MREYLIRVGDDGMVTDLQEVSDLKQFDSAEEMFAELEADGLAPCDGCQQLEAVLVSMIKSLNERLAAAEKRIRDLEARPVVTAEPLPYREYPGSLAWSRPWWDTITVSCNKL